MIVAVILFYLLSRRGKVKMDQSEHSLCSYCFRDYIGRIAKIKNRFLPISKHRVVYDNGLK